MLGLALKAYGMEIGEPFLSGTSWRDGRRTRLGISPDVVRARSVVAGRFTHGCLRVLERSGRRCGRIRVAEDRAEQELSKMR